ncbi:MAG: phytoene desaturase family protein [Candidatus Hodarchaeales archaeon]
MVKKKVAIIGAGISGLSAGCYGQMNGYECTIFEQNDHAGGLAATWKRKDYIIDGGVHFLSGHKPETAFYKILTELGLDDYNFIDMNTYCRFIDEKSGVVIDVTNDLDKLESELLEYFPEDRSRIKELLFATKKFSKVDLSVYGMDKPVELLGYIDKIRDIWEIKGIIKFFTGKFAQTVEEYTEKVNSRIFADFLKKLFLPSVPVWFILMILATLCTNQMCLLGDGSRAFAETIEKRFIELGGKIEYSKIVRKIIVENEKAIGVELEDGSTNIADYVISTIDGYQTVFGLLEGKYVSPEITKRFSAKTVDPVLMISYGVSKEFTDKPWLTMINLEKEVTVAEKAISEIFIRTFNYSNFFSPVGKTVVQVMIEAEWNYWNNLYKDYTTYREVKKRIADEMLGRLGKYFQEIEEKVEIIDVATPVTFSRYTGSKDGSIMGWLPTKDSMTRMYEKTLPGLNNFYLAGQWSMAIGGVSPSIFAARHAIQLLCHKESKKFKTLN